MKFAAMWMTIQLATGCTSAPSNQTEAPDLPGLNSFALAARYGTPDSYQHQGDYLQLNYGGAAGGCRVIVLVDQSQHVAGWAATGKSCSVR